MTTASLTLNDRLRNSPLRHLPRVYFALFALVVFLGIVSPLSVQPDNLVNLIRQGAALGIVAIGTTLAPAASGHLESSRPSASVAALTSVTLVESAPEGADERLRAGG